MKKIVILLLSLFIICEFSMPVYAGRFEVYTPDGYKQLHRYNNPVQPRAANGQVIQLLVDYSGSMSTWITVAKDTLQFILPKIIQSSSVSLRVFGEAPSDRYGYQDAACRASRQVVAASDSNQDKILKGLATSRLGGVTPIEFGLRETIEKDFANLRNYNRYKKKKIVLVTDGGENCGGDPCAYIRNIMKKRKDIQIDVVQIGNDAKLACLADLTGGTFYKVEGERKKLEVAFEKTLNVSKKPVEFQRHKKVLTYKERTPVAQQKAPAYKQKTPQYKQNKPLADRYKYVKF